MSNENFKSRSQIRRMITQSPESVISEIEELRAIHEKDTDDLLAALRERDALRVQLERAERIVKRQREALEYASDATHVGQYCQQALIDCERIAEGKQNDPRT